MVESGVPILILPLLEEIFTFSFAPRLRCAAEESSISLTFVFRSISSEFIVIRFPLKKSPSLLSWPFIIDDFDGVLLNVIEEPSY